MPRSSGGGGAAELHDGTPGAQAWERRYNFARFALGTAFFHLLILYLSGGLDFVLGLTLALRRFAQLNFGV
jgi:hypothetical protein